MTLQHRAEPSTGNSFYGVRSFVKIAINAGKGKVVDVIATAVNLGNDVFDMERSQRRIILMQMTTLASVLGALANLSPDL